MHQSVQSAALSDDASRQSRSQCAPEELCGLWTHPLMDSDPLIVRGLYVTVLQLGSFVDQKFTVYLETLDTAFKVLW